MAFPFSAKISAQPGPQTAFLRSGADICIYGGATGGGKTAGLILEPLRHVSRVANFTAVFFRRTMPQITNPGALWDESLKFYPRLGGTPHLRMHEWRWPRGGKIKFSHLQFETTVYDWQGAQITLICFDELTHFSAHQFFYMVSRNRSTCGVRPYIRATCNPDADSWVADFISWWIDPVSGRPIPERAGVLRYFVRIAEKIVWADRPEAADERHLYPGDGVRQSGAAAGQPGISRLAIVIADTRARAAARRQLEDPARRRAVFQAGVVCRCRRGSGGSRHRPLLGSRRHRKNRVQRSGLDHRRQARPRSQPRLLAIGCGPGARQSGRRRTVVAQYRHAARQAGHDRVRAGSGAGRQEPGAASGAGVERLHRAAGNRKRRQADAVRTVQLAVSRRQCEDPAGVMERGAVPRSRRFPRSCA